MILLSIQVQTSFYHIDPSHELCFSFHLQGYKISVSRFPDAEAFSTLAKFTGTKFILSETVTFDTDVGKGDYLENILVVNFPLHANIYIWKIRICLYSLWVVPECNHLV